ncbi:hypothetical protein JAAARDRAFT_72345 [Jaapia argillacea MUCL 33604]|uniref:Uncharacterized protein n=1 Tax=Jaapia argillacea MUCL 33604 TaxID=933084 RepID=A0A067PTK5_9AGAM|nr:hypothetical protein JAAARDRAFT_72345 [Jaapia argillacea MUCL 33604]
MSVPPSNLIPHQGSRHSLSQRTYNPSSSENTSKAQDFTVTNPHHLRPNPSGPLNRYPSINVVKRHRLGTSLPYMSLRRSGPRLSPIIPQSPINYTSPMYSTPLQVRSKRFIPPLRDAKIPKSRQLSNPSFHETSATLADCIVAVIRELHLLPIVPTPLPPAHTIHGPSKTFVRQRRFLSYVSY